jgi:hypothetical protein
MEKEKERKGNERKRTRKENGDVVWRLVLQSSWHWRHAKVVL